MRVLPALYTLFASSVIAQSSNSRLEKRDAVAVDADDAENGPGPTIFNDVEVPPLLDIEGEKFNATIEDGWWFVKHHSPYCPHCLHVAPTWQTLYEYYFTSKPAPSADASSTPLNSFTSYYNFHFGNLDCVAFGTACSDHKVGSFPTFIMYKDGVETKRFEGAKDMKTISKFIEETLETIHSGSRPVDGPELPAVGDKSSKDYQGPKISEPTGGAKATAAELVADQKPVATGTVKSTTTTPTVSQDVKENEKNTPSARVIEPNPAKQPKKLVVPAKPTAIPNTTGKTISFTAESFQNQVTMTQEPWFIKFYAPWCHHCQGMAPNWIQLAKEMKGKLNVGEGKLNVGEVNCDVESRLCKDVRVRGYPTILFFRGGEHIDALEFQELEEKEEVIFLYFYDHATTTEDFAALERLTLSLIGHAKLSVWLPIVPELTALNSREIMDGKLVVLGILSRERSSEFLMAKKEIKSAALEWMDKETIAFQRERQELRDAKQLRLEEAEDRNDQRALRAAKSIRINMDQSDHKVFWERWIRTTYGIEVAKDGEKVIINDEDILGHYHYRQLYHGIPDIHPRNNTQSAITGHPFLAVALLIGILVGTAWFTKGRTRLSRSYLGLDEKDGLLGGPANGKVD
ncbi:thioredoxin [Diplocarpon rosae]|nr:thioredoxin [Diplocarpon rosae]